VGRRRARPTDSPSDSGGDFELAALFRSALAEVETPHDKKRR